MNMPLCIRYLYFRPVCEVLSVSLAFSQTACTVENIISRRCQEVKAYHEMKFSVKEPLWLLKGL